MLPEVQRDIPSQWMVNMEQYNHDIIVIGSGTAGLCAAIRGAELGADIAVLEKSPAKRAGGQTRFSESFRVPSAETDLSEYGYEFAIPDYTTDEFYQDILDRSNGKADPELARVVADEAPKTVEWLTGHGVEWNMEPLAAGYTAGRTWFDGESYVETLTERAAELGAEFFYRAEARRLRRDGQRVVGVEVAHKDDYALFDGTAVILAAGAYESSPRKRAQFFGTGYDDMTVRGSRYNTGEAIEAALDVGGMADGQWSGAHMAIIDANAPAVEGGANRVDGYQYGVILDVDGQRFVDEGEDARAHTYAKFGRRIFERPKHLAYIVLDAPKQELARATGPTDPFRADSLAALFAQFEIDTESALETVSAYNEACEPKTFDPNRLDGNAATDVNPPKSNWAIPLSEPPFFAYPVTGGITFAFGGVAINTSAEVLNRYDAIVPGLFGAGNSTGGLFYDNYPGGTGQTNAAVFGRIAAESAVDSL